MKNIFQLLALLFVISAMGACTMQRSVAVGKAENNPDYTVSYLFEHDGCKVYRFYDSRSSSYVYFTTGGDATSIKNDSTHRRTVTYRNRTYRTRTENAE